MIDCRVVNLSWGIELLHNGDRLAEYWGRFKPDRYCKAIQGRGLVDWLMVDFASGTLG